MSHNEKIAEGHKELKQLKKWLIDEFTKLIDAHTTEAIAREKIRKGEGIRSTGDLAYYVTKKLRNKNIGIRVLSARKMYRVAYAMINDKILKEAPHKEITSPRLGIVHNDVDKISYDSQIATHAIDDDVDEPLKGNQVVLRGALARYHKARGEAEMLGIDPDDII